MKFINLLVIAPFLGTAIDVRELHDHAFNHLSLITPSDSPGHLWLLKQIDRFMLYISVSYAPDEDRARIVSSIARFGLSILTEESLTESEVRMVARIIEAVTSRGVYGEDDLEKTIGELAWYLSRDLGVNLLETDGFLIPIERQAVMMELLKTRMGRNFEYLGRMDLDELLHLKDCYQLILNSYNNIILQLGFDVSHVFPALQEIETVKPPFIGENLMRMARYTSLVQEAAEQADSVIQWSIVLDGPLMTELRRSLGAWGIGTDTLMERIKMCSRDDRPQIPCMRFDQIQEALLVFHKRKVSISKKNAEMVKEMLLNNLLDEGIFYDSFSDGIYSLRQYAELSREFDESVPDDFPLESVSHIRIRSHLRNFVTEDEVFLKGLFTAIISALDRLSPHQLELLDYVLHEYLNVNPTLLTKCQMAVKLAQSCGIKLFDFYKPVGIESRDLSLIRSVISNIVWTQWEARSAWLSPILEPVLKLRTPIEEREMFARAMKIYTVARMEFERRPISESRDLTWSGFLPDQVLRTDIETFVHLIVEYREHRIATGAITKLPDDIKKYIGSLVSPVKAFEGLSRRISTLYRNRMDSLPTRPRVASVQHVPTYSVRRLPGDILTAVVKLDMVTQRDQKQISKKAARLIVWLREIVPKDWSWNGLIHHAMKWTSRAMAFVGRFIYSPAENVDIPTAREQSNVRVLEEISDLICHFLELLPQNLIVDEVIDYAMETIDDAVHEVAFLAKMVPQARDGATETLNKLHRKAEILREAIEILSLQSSDS